MNVASAVALRSTLPDPANVRSGCTLEVLV